jgi:hypothetical protein
MLEDSPVSTNLYALLIGIDCYLPNEKSGTPNPANLGGCVNDVNRIEAYLRRQIGLPETQILKLTSTISGAGTPTEPVEQWPTRENILKGFKWLDNVAKPGDQLYIYYSGHGARVRTPLKYQGLKLGEGFDEALVPCDYNQGTDRFLRDFELAHVLRGYVQRRLETTIILDSCHSGGATRAELNISDKDKRDRVRSIGLIDEILPPPELTVAPHEELKATVMSMGRRTIRDFTVENGWLLEPQGYVLLAACRPSEYAYEHYFSRNYTGGVLTYWLLDSLKELGPEASFQSLYNRILAQVNSQFPHQTPQLQGELNRAGFKHKGVTEARTVPVLEVGDNEVVVGVGQAEGIGIGERFAIFAAGETNLLSGRKLALVSITDVGATRSRAVVVERFTSEAIQKGDQALPLESGTATWRRTVKLNTHDAVSAEKRRMLEVVGDVLRQGENNHLALAEMGQAADFTVSISESDEYLIKASWDGDLREVPRGPRADIDGAPALLIRRMMHLSKYLKVYELENFDPNSPLRSKISVELLGSQAEYLMGNRPAPQPFPQGPALPKLKTGEWTFVKIQNNSLQVLNFTVLDLRPNWSIRQIYPAGAALYEPVDPGQSLTLPLRAALPEGFDQGIDLIKVMATEGPSNFRWLVLPALNHQGDTPVWRGQPTTKLEILLKTLVDGAITIRDFESTSVASHEWISVQVEVKTGRG